MRNLVLEVSFGGPAMRSFLCTEATPSHHKRHTLSSRAIMSARRSSQVPLLQSIG